MMQCRRRDFVCVLPSTKSATTCSLALKWHGVRPSFGLFRVLFRATLGAPSSSSRSPLSSRRVMATGVLPLYFTVQLRHIRSPSAHVLSGNSCLSKASTYRLACNNEPPPKRCAVATASSFRPCFRRFSTCSFKIVCFTINIFF